MTEILFDLDAPIGEWFPFQTSSVNDDHEPVFDEPMADIETGPAGCFRQPDFEFFEKLHKKTRKRVVEHPHNAKTRQLDRVVSFDPINDKAERTEREELWDYCIVAWKNIKDKTGKEIPCTKANKIALMKNPMFARWFNKCLKDCAASAGIVRKEEDENL